MWNEEDEIAQLKKCNVRMAPFLESVSSYPVLVDSAALSPFLFDLKKKKFWHILLKYKDHSMYSHGIEIKAQRLTILIAERRSISWGSMFGSVRRKEKRSGQNIFPNQRPIFCVFFVVFYSSMQ